MEIFKSFGFEAAHQLGRNVPDGHRYGRVHGHSFQAEVYVSGTPAPETGWIIDFAALSAAIAPLREQLDHNYLNDIPGLENPTLETITAWIWDRLAPDVAGLSRIVLRRGACGEGCSYSGPSAAGGVTSRQ